MPCGTSAASTAFFAGFRLASGIHRELEEIPPYNFEDEDERLAHRKNQSRKRRRIDHGETQSQRRRKYP